MKNLLYIILFFLVLSCEQILTIQDISNEYIQLLSPLDSDIFEELPINLDWESLELANSYHLEVYKTTNGFQQVIDTILFKSNYSLDSIQVDNDYSWTVSFLNEAYESMSSSRDFKFYKKKISDKTTQLISPPNEYINDSGVIQFNWERLQEAEGYVFELVTPSFQSPLRVVKDTILNENKYELEILEPSDYQWRVRAIKEEQLSQYEQRSFVVPSILEGVEINLVSPFNNSVIHSSLVKFNWTKILNDQVLYRFSLATPNFLTPEAVLIDTLITSNHFTTELSLNKNYQWKVNAQTAYEYTPHSSYNVSVTDTVNNLTNKIVEITAPYNQAVLDTTLLNLSWNRVVGANSYLVEVAIPSFEKALQVLVSQTVEETLLEIKLEKKAPYEWRVKALNDFTETPFSYSKFLIE